MYERILYKKGMICLNKEFIQNIADTLKESVNEMNKMELNFEQI